MFARRFVPGSLVFCLGFSLTACSDPSIIAIQITPTTQTFVGVGKQTAQFTAIGTFRKGTEIPTTQDVTNMVTWKSQSTSVATIGTSGVAAPSGYGTTQISASMEGFTGLVISYATVTVCLPDATNPSKCAP